VGQSKPCDSDACGERTAIASGNDLLISFLQPVQGAGQLTSGYARDLARSLLLGLTLCSRLR
jgi:hypothetical protein